MRSGDMLPSFSSQLDRLGENKANWSNITFESWGPVSEGSEDGEPKAFFYGNTEGEAEANGQRNVYGQNNVCHIYLDDDGSIEITAEGEIRLSGSTIKLSQTHSLTILR